MYRFFVNAENILEDTILVTGSDVNHIKNVLRMKIGEEILISDGNDKEYVCSILNMDDEKVEAKILDINGPGRELPIKVYLFQGLPKENGRTWSLWNCAGKYKKVNSKVRCKKGNQ